MTICVGGILQDIIKNYIIRRSIFLGTDIDFVTVDTVKVCRVLTPEQAAASPDRFLKAILNGFNFIYLKTGDAVVCV